MRAVLTTVTMIAALTCVGMASDGVIEINQARALAGGVTPGDTPGFPVTIDSPGSYRLTSELDVPSGLNGIQVNASNVVIDLNGFAIIAKGLPFGSNSNGILLSNDVTAVTNGIIRGFGVGISASGSHSRVERVLISDVASGIALKDEALVSGCTVRNAVVYGIRANTGLITGNVVSSSLVGLSMVGDVGYSNNVLRKNQQNVGGGVSLGANLCDSKLCP